MRLLLVLLAACVLLSVVVAKQPPVVEESEGSIYDIVYPAMTTYRLGENVTLRFQVYNISGFRLDNSSVSCELDICNEQCSAPEHYDLEFTEGVHKWFKEYDKVNETGLYSYLVYCNSSGAAGFVATSFEVTVDGMDTPSGDGALLAAVVAIPLVLAFLLVFGSWALGEEHQILKMFLFLLSFVPVLFAFHLGVLSVVKLYHFTELTDAVAGGVYWIGLVFTVIIFYFLIYVFIKAVHVAAQKRKERLKY